MKSRTHMVVGVAGSLLLVHPQSWHMLISGVIAAVVGGTVSDIDARQSRPRSRATLLIAFVFLAVVAMFVLDGHYNLGLYQLIISNQQLLEIIEGSVAFVLICALGMNIKHRAFMHSFFCMVALSFCVFLINPDIVPFFMISFLAHIFLDYLNSYDICFMYPFPFCKHCLRWTSDDGFTDRILFMLGTAASIWLIILLAADIGGFFTWFSGLENAEFHN